ncbi:hypothetical protein [Paucidesulfovibrio longus]|uniref:hypothetical protein n=1 Tax=Paucidesulfovibrio longus TaxID=889 RepID=UPI00041CED4E|nr:hypothetical protein [Paucidesulfovibrio longus]
MAYSSEDMRLMGGVPGQQPFLYRSADDAATVRTEGYFDLAVEHYNLSSGDIVLCVSGYGTSPVPGLLVADVNAGTAATIPLS